MSSSISSSPHSSQNEEYATAQQQIEYVSRLYNKLIPAFADPFYVIVADENQPTASSSSTGKQQAVVGEGQTKSAHEVNN